jgi:hypothetical protein
MPMAIAIPTMARKTTRNPASCHVLYRVDSRSDITTMGPELAERAGRHDEAAERRAETATIAKHGQEHAKTRRTQRQRDHHRRVLLRDHVQDSHCKESQHDRKYPPQRSERERLTPDLAEIELHPRHEQRQGHAEREHHGNEALELHEVEHVRSDQDAEQHLDDDDRDLES